MNINPNYDYKVTVLNCVDGDSFDVEVDLGFLITMKQRVHVWGMTSRELHSTDTTEKAAGLADRNFAQALLPIGTATLMRSHKANGHTEKDGHWFAEIVLPDGRDFREVMLASGHGQPSFGDGAKPT